MCQKVKCIKSDMWLVQYIGNQLSSHPFHLNSSGLQFQKCYSAGRRSKECCQNDSLNKNGIMFVGNPYVLMTSIIKLYIIVCILTIPCLWVFLAPLLYTKFHEEIWALFLETSTPCNSFDLELSCTLTFTTSQTENLNMIGEVYAKMASFHFLSSAWKKGSCTSIWCLCWHWLTIGF